MRRRHLLGVLVSFPAAGCLGPTAGSRRRVAYEDLQPAARNEVRTAYERGEYTQCGELAVMNEFEDLGDAVVRYEGRAWRLVVSIGDRGPDAECSSTYSLELVPA